jgi:hypothetical protein
MLPLLECAAAAAAVMGLYLWMVLCFMLLCFMLLCFMLLCFMLLCVIAAASSMCAGKTEGSKGGVGLALRIMHTSIAFVSCHLASKKAILRFSQFKELVKVRAL